MTEKSSPGAEGSPQKHMADSTSYVPVMMELGCPSCKSQFMNLRLVPVKEHGEEFVIAELRCLGCGSKYLLNAKFIKV